MSFFHWFGWKEEWAMFKKAVWDIAPIWMFSLIVIVMLLGLSWMCKNEAHRRAELYMSVLGGK